MYYCIAALNVFIAAIAQILLKKGAIQKHESILKEYINPWVIGGYSLMGISLLGNIYALSKGLLLVELGTIEGLGFLFVPTLSFIIFKERITPRKIFAIALILAGMVVFFWG